MINNKKVNKKTKKTLTIRLGEDQIKTLKEIAIADDRSVSAIIRRMVNDGIEKENNKNQSLP